MDNVRRMEKATKKRRRDKEDKGSTYRRQIKHDTHVIRPGWTLDINWQDRESGQFEREWAIERYELKNLDGFIDEFDSRHDSDSVTRVNNSTRVTIFGDSDSTRVTLKKMVTRLESHFSQNDSTRVTVNHSSQSHFYKISEFLMDKPSSFAHKEMRIFCFSDDQDWGKFSVLTV